MRARSAQSSRLGSRYARLGLWRALAPPQNATPAQLRLNGIKQILIGGSALGVCLTILSRALGPTNDEGSPVFRATGALLMVPLTVAYLLFMGGCYSLVTGCPPGSEAKSALASAARIVLSILFILATLVAAIALWLWITPAPAG